MLAMTAMFAVYVAVRAGRFDIVHAHQGLYPAFGAVCGARFRHLPCLTKIGNAGDRFDLDVLQRLFHCHLGRSMARMLAKVCPAFVSLNPQIAQQLEKWGVVPERITAIPNGVPLEPERTLSRRCAARKKLGLPAERPIAVCVGSFHNDKKNQETLIRAGALLKQRDSCPLLLFLGDGSRRALMERIAREQGIGQSTIFVGWVANVQDYLQAADIFVLPSRVEGLSNALLEAMSLGLPCICSDIPGNREAIAASSCGLLYRPDDADALASHIHNLLTNPAETRRLGKAARQCVKERYAIEYVAEAYEALYLRLLSGDTP